MYYDTEIVNEKIYSRKSIILKSTLLKINTLLANFVMCGLQFVNCN